MVTITGVITGGTITFKEHFNSDYYDLEARITEAKNLDGTRTYSHNGVAIEDNVFSIAADLTETQETDIKAIHEGNTLVQLSCKYGFYEGYIKRLKIRNSRMTLTFLIYEKIT